MIRCLNGLIRLGRAQNLLPVTRKIAAMSSKLEHSASSQTIPEMRLMHVKNVLGKLSLQKRWSTTESSVSGKMCMAELK